MEDIVIYWICIKFKLADGLTNILHGLALSEMRDKLHLVDAGPPRKV